NLSARSPREELDPPRAGQAFRELLEGLRPELVHFHHLHKLGLSLAHVAARSGLPTVYTAHDWFPLTSEYTFLAPDLAPLEGLDAGALARCDLARELLDSIPQLTDHHGFARESELEAPERERLRALLHGDPRSAGVSPERLAQAVAERRDLELRRREAF